MTAIKTAKVFEILSYLGLFATVVAYFFAEGFKGIPTIMALLVICILRYVAVGIKAKHFEKEYFKLKDDNEFMQRRIDELQKQANETIKQL